MVLGDVPEECKQLVALLMDCQGAAQVKLSLLHGSYSGALVLIAEPSRADGMVLPSTVVKFDKSSDIEKETKLTQEHGPRWGPTYPRVLDCKLQDAGAEARGICRSSSAAAVSACHRSPARPPLQPSRSSSRVSLRDATTRTTWEQCSGP